MMCSRTNAILCGKRVQIRPLRWMLKKKLAPKCPSAPHVSRDTPHFRDRGASPVKGNCALKRRSLWLVEATLQMSAEAGKSEVTTGSSK